MNRSAVFCVVFLLLGLAACSSKSDEAMPTADEMTPVERPRDVRPAPASSGMSSDPGNPGGLPGPSSGLGTSPNRY